MDWDWVSFGVGYVTGVTSGAIIGGFYLLSKLFPKGVSGGR